MKTPTSHKTASGFTLVELLVSIVLGLILVAVMLNVYLGSKATYNKQEDVSRLQENGRVALDVLGRTIRVSGFKSDPAGTYNVIFPASALALKGTAGGSGASDTLAIRFKGSGNGSGTADGTVVDCLGTAKDSNQMIFNNFYIANNSSGRPSLFCDTSDDSTDNGTEIISDIENMRFLYGVDTTNDGTVDYYVPAGLVTNWDQVASVQIGLLAVTQNQVNQKVDTGTYSVLGNSFNPVDDRRARRLYTIIITLRNRTP